MSEYQYYEFRAIDRPLSKSEMAEVRGLSTRAEITATGFINEYHFGSFKGNPEKMMQRYYDAHLYFANWGTHCLMLRWPVEVLDAADVEPYLVNEACSKSATRTHLVLTFESQDDSGDYEDPSDLAELLPLRDELARGDMRALYLAWLSGVSSGAVDEDETEPLVPPGLADLTATQRNFADFMRVDEDLVTVAAQQSAANAIAPASQEKFEPWLRNLPEQERMDMLMGLIKGDQPQARMVIQRRFEQSQSEIKKPREQNVAPRRAGELLAAAEKSRVARKQAEAQRQAEAKEKRDRKAAIARNKYLDELSQRASNVWDQVHKLIATMQPKGYAEAVVLLIDLKDLAARQNMTAPFEERMLALRAKYSGRPALMARFNKSELP